MDAYAEHYGQLVGATIISYGGLVPDEFGADPFPVLIARTADGRTAHLYIQRDPEGNGGGHMEIIYG